MPLSHMKGADNVPICDKYALTIKEAVAYFNIGEKKLVLAFYVYYLNILFFNCLVNYCIHTWKQSVYILFQKIMFIYFHNFLNQIVFHIFFIK